MIVQPDFLTHWKTRKLCTRLKEKHAPLYVIRLWSLCHTSKRDIIPADCETLAAICEYEGDPEKLMSAMLDCGFIEPEIDGNHIVHGWSEVNQRLIHNWTAGLNGGRPKVAKDKPKENPRVSQTKPIDGLDREIDREMEGKPAQSKPARNKPQADAEWLNTLAIEYAKIGIDVKEQEIKARAWLTGPKGKGRSFTRQYFINWLSRVDRNITKPMVATSTPPAPRVRSYDDYVADIARDLWEHRDDDSGFRRVLSTWRDKTKDMPKQNGLTVIDEALDIVKRKRNVK